MAYKSPAEHMFQIHLLYNFQQESHFWLQTPSDTQDRVYGNVISNSCGTITIIRIIYTRDPPAWIHGAYILYIYIYFMC